ncbi:MAG: nodulation protein NfeD [Candidatus Kapaibacterium sp.]
MRVILIFILTLIAYQQLTAGKVTVLTVEGAIGPAIESYIHSSLEEASEYNVEAVIIRLNTPGGLVETTRNITGRILDSEVPVIVYVYPSGGRAGSAGVFITLSGHIAVMASGTNIGAAHPVGLGGAADSSVMGQKVENDVAAYARSLAQKRGKNIEWAENAVRESISSSEIEALELGVIDFIANDLNELLDKCDGMTVYVNGARRELDFSSHEIIYRDMNYREEFLQFISNPNIAYLFILLGIYGIFFEIKSPGSIFPGAVGGFSILLAAYSLQMLPVNYVGLGLIAIAFILFVLEIFVVSYGMLSIGGIVSLVVGSIMLIDSPLEIMRISMSLIIVTVIITVLLFGVIIYYGIKAQNSKKTTGSFSILGERGIAKTDIKIQGTGKVLVLGEIWTAESDEFIEKDSAVLVSDIQSMKIKVVKDIDITK